MVCLRKRLLVHGVRGTDGQDPTAAHFHPFCETWDPGGRGRVGTWVSDSGCPTGHSPIHLVSPGPPPSPKVPSSVSDLFSGPLLRPPLLALYSLTHFPSPFATRSFSPLPQSVTFYLPPLPLRPSPGFHLSSPTCPVLSRQPWSLGYRQWWVPGQ